MSFRPRKGQGFPQRTPTPRFPQRDPDRQGPPPFGSPTKKQPNKKFELAASPMRKQKMKADSRLSAIKRKLGDNAPAKPKG